MTAGTLPRGEIAWRCAIDANSGRQELIEQFCLRERRAQRCQEVQTSRGFRCVAGVQPGELTGQGLDRRRPPVGVKPPHLGKVALEMALVNKCCQGALIDRRRLPIGERARGDGHFDHVGRQDEIPKPQRGVHHF